MITAIVLDGWHAKEALRLPDVRQTISLLKPPTITVCDCDPHFSPETFDVPDYRIDYKLCFVSVDRKMALYSQNGSSEDVLRWFSGINYVSPYNAGETLTVGCHDEKAIFTQERAAHG